MRKATVTYRAPEGDNEVVYMGDVRFINGESVEINSNDHPHLMSKIEGNQHFDVEMGEDVPDERKRGPGRPRTRDLKAGMTEANDHDFEADRRNAPGGANADRPKLSPEQQQADQVAQGKSANATNVA